MGLNQYVKASVPEPYTILGLRLRPFALGHFLLMRRFGCAYAEDRERAMSNPSDLIKDFIMALVICSLTYEDFLEAISSDKLVVSSKRFKWFGAEVQRVVSFRKWLAHWGKVVSKASQSKDFVVLDKLALFRAYLNDGMEVPLFWEGDANEDAPTSGAHWTQSVLLVLTGELGYTQSEALNAPLSKALADYFRFAERNGLVTLMTDEEVEEAQAQLKGKA